MSRLLACSFVFYQLLNKTAGGVEELKWGREFSFESTAWATWIIRTWCSNHWVIGLSTPAGCSACNNPTSAPSFFTQAHCKDSLVAGHSGHMNSLRSSCTTTPCPLSRMQQITRLCMSDRSLTQDFGKRGYRKMLLSLATTIFKRQLKALSALKLLKSEDQLKRRRNVATKSQEMKGKRGEKGHSTENDIPAITFQQDLLL